MQDEINRFRSQAVASLPRAPVYSEAEAMARTLEVIAEANPDLAGTLTEAAAMLRDQEMKIDWLYYEIQYCDDR